MVMYSSGAPGIYLMVMTRYGFKIVRKNHLRVECSVVE